MSENWQDKYRGTTTYFKVYAALVNAAECRGLVTYQEIAQIMGLPLSGSHMGREVGNMIGVISEDEIAYGRPMLSAIVVGSTASQVTDSTPGRANWDVFKVTAKRIKNGSGRKNAKRFTRRGRRPLAIASCSAPNAYSGESRTRNS